MMKDRKVCCLNNISRVGTDCFREGYTLTDNMEHTNIYEYNEKGEAVLSTAQ